jgi:hypothetical protein
MWLTRNFRISLWSILNQEEIVIVVFWVVTSVKGDISVSGEHAASNHRKEVMEYASLSETFVIIY